MSFISVTTEDADRLWLNLDHIIMLKVHPSEKKPTNGIVVLSSGREIFVTLEQYHLILNLIPNRK